MPDTNEAYRFSHPGICSICETETVFSATGPFFRNTLCCLKCNSRPRHRALMHVLKTFFPKWRDLAIHEGSPGWDPLSKRLTSECKNYTASQYDIRVPFGSVVDAPRHLARRYNSENLEDQTFADNSFDLVLTQDVFEHIFRPDLAIKEIARTLKIGGATLMTAPIVMRQHASRRRAFIENGQVKHLLEPQYHGNPLPGEGALVTVDWGYDIVAYLQKHSQLSFLMIKIDDVDKGIRGELNEVIIGFKRPIPAI